VNLYPLWRKLCSLVLLLSLCGFATEFAVCTAWAQVAVGPAATVAGIDADVQRAMKELHVPGVAVGVIIDGKVVLAKGYGVREIGKPALVDGDTLFDIGSMSKSFTATAVAAVVDDGKLEWDKPVIGYLPWFRMYDPIATQLITPRDLLTHRSGLPRHDFIRTSTYLTREELIRRIRYLEPSYTFRQAYQYNNLMYVTAGYLAGSVAGTTWETLVKQRIFTPLGMTHSNASAVELQQSDDYAHPHDYVDGKIIPIPVYDYQKFGVGPNGAVNSCANDMLKYLAFHLSDGVADGKQVISITQMQELHKPSTVTPSGDEYALGWEVIYHHGHKVLEHGGAINGFTSYMMLLTDEKAGIVVLNNQGSSLPEIIAQDLMDRILGLKPEDYLGKTLADEARYEPDRAARRTKFESARILNTRPTLDLSAYTGTYFHPAYGNIRVEREGDGLIVRFDALNLSLEHYHFDTFAYDTSLVQFHLSDSGKVSEMLLPLEPAVKPFVFVKQDK
jgi:CubicO group peptidase (beta-lactamase class C family)